MKHFLFYVATIAFIGLTGYISPIEARTENSNDDLTNLLNEGSLPVSFKNDATYPWTITENGIASSGNAGNPYTSSSLSFSYSSDYQTEIGLSWRIEYGYNNYLSIYVDGAPYSNMTSGSWTRKRFYLPRGKHVVEFRDSISNDTYNGCYGQVQDLMVREIKELESSLLSPNSKVLTFENDKNYLWLTNEGYVSSSNYGYSNSTSRFSCKFSIDKPSKFSFEQALSGPRNYGADYHSLKFLINGELYTTYTGNSNTYSLTSVMLVPGDYTVEWVDSICNTSDEYISYIKNVELSDDWANIKVSTAGTLGVEVLYQFDILNDVELLSVSGTINDADWAAIKQMKHLTGLDLSDAKFNNVPDYAFDGLSRLSYVTLSEGMTSIGQYAFRGTQIWDIDIPSSVTSIGQYAFASTRVRSISFKEESQLRTIGYSAFYSCSSLREFIMPNTVTKLESRNNYSNADYDSNTFRDCTSLKKLYFSDSLSVIARSTCNNCTSLSEVHLPQNITNLYNGAFYNTYNLHKIDIPETLQHIGNEVFYSSALDSITLPIKLTSLSNEAFSYCNNLKYVELPSYIPSYNNNFYDCNNIQTVVCKSATPPAISNDPFSYGPSKSSMTLYVPSYAVANYKLDSYWYQFGNIQEMDIDLDYWRVSGNLMLANNRRMDGKPDVDLYYGSQTTVSGNAPMEVSNLNLYVNDSNPFRLLNSCESFSADSITTYYSVSSNTWYFFSPLYDVKLADVKHSANASFVFRYYNGQQRATSGAGNSWQNVSGGMLYAGQGYIFQCNTNGDVIMPAIKETQGRIFNTGEITKTLVTYESDNSANKSWNYVGNPYPCYYDIYYMDFTAPITVRNGSNYYAYSISDDNFVLAPMQSFFVQKPDAIDNIVFRPEGRQLNSAVNRVAYANLLRASEKKTRYVFNIEITNGQSTDRTRVVLNEAKNLDYDIDCDAAKFMSDDTSIPQIYTMDSKANRMAINERPLSDGIVNLGVSVGAAGSYTLSSSRHDGSIYLHDAKTGETIDLSNSDYSFDADNEAGTDSRFTLSFDRTATAIEKATEEQTQIVGTDGALIITVANGADIQVYNVNGSWVASSDKSIKLNLPAGLYLVKVNGKTTKAIVY
ncbi:leucine-rich repeat protein [Bacteroides sp.]